MRGVRVPDRRLGGYTRSLRSLGTVRVVRRSARVHLLAVGRRPDGRYVTLCGMSGRSEDRGSPLLRGARARAREAFPGDAVA